MKCKNCNYEITVHQDKEFQGCCCTYCMDKTKTRLCILCGVPIEDEWRKTGYCSAGCAGEHEELTKN